MNEVYNLTCSSCFHFHPPGEGAQSGSCWRYPPTALSIPIPPKGAIVAPGNAQDVQTGGIMTIPVHPPVTADTLACGEHELPEDDAPVDVREPYSESDRA